MKKLKNFIRNNEAATAIEYGLIAALIAVAAIVAMNSVGGGVINAFQSAADAFEEGGIDTTRPTTP